MRELSPEEIQAYYAKGYVVIPDVFPTQELQEIDNEIDRLYKEKKGIVPEGRDNEGLIFQLSKRSVKTKEFARDERILHLIKDIVKPGIAIHSSKLVSKLPQSDTVCHWHQDDAYYIRNSISQTRMSVWAPLQNAHLENGCMWVVPESHKSGLQPHSIKDYGTCRRSMDEENIDLSNAVPVEIPAGAILLFNALLWHGSKGNHTDQVRRAYIISYQEATVQEGEHDGYDGEVLRES